LPLHEVILTRRANQFVFSEMACPAPFAKIFRFRPEANQFTDLPRLVPLEGRIAIVTSAGRDAVDARASGDVRGWQGGSTRPVSRRMARGRTALSPSKPLAEMGARGRQSRVVLAPVAGVKSVEASRPDRAWYKPLIRG